MIYRSSGATPPLIIAKQKGLTFLQLEVNDEKRLFRKITQAELADAVGVTAQTISLYETGKREPKLRMWEKLATVLIVSVPFLQGIENGRVALDESDKEFTCDGVLVSESELSHMLTLLKWLRQAGQK